MCRCALSTRIFFVALYIYPTQKDIFSKTTLVPTSQLSFDLKLLCKNHEKFKELKKMAKPNLLPVLVHARGTGTGMDKKKVDPPYCSKEDILCVANL